MQLYRLGLSLAVAFLLGACGAASSTTPTTQKLSVTAKEFAYAPTTLEVTSGQPVEITFQNTGAVEHDFSIAEIDRAASPTYTGEAQSDHMMGGMGEQPKLHVAAAAGVKRIASKARRMEMSGARTNFSGGYAIRSSNSAIA
jgi:plastocyanin